MSPPRLGKTLRGPNGMGAAEIDQESVHSEMPESAQLSPAPGESLPELTLASAVRHNWFFVLLPIVVLVTAAVLAAFLRSPTYSAETRLSIGGLDASSPVTNTNFFVAAQSLAQTYGRSIQGDAVIETLARQTQASPAFLRSHVSAFIVPTTPLLSVVATSASPQEAIRLSNLASQALSGAAKQATHGTLAPLLNQYREAEAERQRGERRVRYVQGTGNKELLISARARLAVEEVRADSLRDAFVGGLERQQSVAEPVQITEHASTASSDRYSVLQLWLFIAFVIGLIVGLALALFRESRLLRYITP